MIDLEGLLSESKNYIITKCDVNIIDRILINIKEASYFKDGRLYIVVDCNDDIFKIGYNLLDTFPNYMFSSVEEFNLFKLLQELKDDLKSNRPHILSKINEAILKNTDPDIYKILVKLKELEQLNQYEKLLTAVHENITLGEITSEDYKDRYETFIINTMYACIFERELEKIFPDVHRHHETHINYETFLKFRSWQDIVNKDRYGNCQIMLINLLKKLIPTIRTRLIFTNIESIKDPWILRLLQRFIYFKGSDKGAQIDTVIFSNGSVPALHAIVGYPVKPSKVFTFIDCSEEYKPGYQKIRE